MIDFTLIPLLPEPVTIGMLPTELESLTNTHKQQALKFLEYNVYSSGFNK